MKAVIKLEAAIDVVWSCASPHPLHAYRGLRSMGDECSHSGLRKRCHLEIQPARAIFQAARFKDG